MKKTLILIAPLALALGACNNDAEEVNEAAAELIDERAPSAEPARVAVQHGEGQGAAGAEGLRGDEEREDLHQRGEPQPHLQGAGPGGSVGAGVAQMEVGQGVQAGGGVVLGVGAAGTGRPGQGHDADYWRRRATASSQRHS